jgi:hypothetical protein
MQAPGDLSFMVFTGTGCQWTATAGAAWITLTGNSSGTGSGTVRFRISDNWDAPREGLLVVHGVLPDRTASAHVAQAGCVYWVSKDTIDVSATGGPGSFDVLQQSLPNTCGGPLQESTSAELVRRGSRSSSMPGSVTTGRLAVSARRQREARHHRARQSVRVNQAENEPGLPITRRHERGDTEIL